VNVLGGRIGNVAKLGVYEPISVKQQIIKAAVEAAMVILRIDDLLLAPKFKPKIPRYPPGVPPMPWA